MVDRIKKGIDFNMNEVKNNNQTFGNVLKILIKQSGLSNREISKGTKIGIQTIEKYLSDGGYPTFNNLITLADQIIARYDILLQNILFLSQCTFACLHYWLHKPQNRHDISVLRLFGM